MNINLFNDFECVESFNLVNDFEYVESFNRHNFG